ncbi:MAG TPA: peptidylprolyl isomerase [Pirellulales bacterium]|nr:peptidylprolyl isomerase [Pirellulales bacterium]
MLFAIHRGWFCALSLAALATAGCERSAASPTAPEEAAADRESKPVDRAANGAPSAGEYFPTVVLETSLGRLTIKLDPQAAPRTVNNFLHYVESGFYNQTIFHQVEPGYVILGGGYTADLAEKPARYPIPNEATHAQQNRRGTLAMARQPDSIDSSTCQFFVNLTDNFQLDHRGDTPADFGYCVFGEVVEGLEVLDQIAGVEVQATEQFERLPVETVLIESAYRLR